MTPLGTGKARKTGKKNRKFGRGLRKPAHNRYTSEMRWIKNKAKGLKKHLKRCPGDRTASVALELIS